MVDYIKNQTLERHRTALFGALISFIILSGVVYLYCVSSIVMATVARDYNIQSLGVIQREYQEVEKQYLSLLSKFSLDYAYSLGFINSGSALIFVSHQTTMAQNSAYGEAIR